MIELWNYTIKKRNRKANRNLKIKKDSPISRRVLVNLRKINYSALGASAAGASALGASAAGAAGAAAGAG